MFELFDPEADFQVSVGSNLPHWFQPGVTYFVTFRTHDSLPADVSKRWYAERVRWLAQRGIRSSDRTWRAQLARLTRAERTRFHRQFSQRFMENLDKGWGACVLRRPKLAAIVADSLWHFDGDRYDLSDFVVMPNHVHILVGLRGTTEIVAQCNSWKRFTALKLNQAMRTTGRFWSEESFDHLVRSPAQFEAIRRYIAANPPSAKLTPGEFILYQRPRTSPIK